jgi:hypothetical protein
MGYFPVQWKRAHVVILRKPGKDDSQTNPKVVQTNRPTLGNGENARKNDGE